MKECCKYWKEQKRIYTEELCIKNVNDNGISPFVNYMRNIIGCPNCLKSFRKEIKENKKTAILCNQCGSLILSDGVVCQNCEAVNN